MTATLVRAEDWQPPPPAALFGEISPDGQRIILIGQGDAYSLNDTAARLKKLTCLVTEEAGGAFYSVPATWAVVTQLSHSFTGSPLTGTARWVPGPGLCAWIITELGRRTSRPDQASYPEYPPWLKARSYQDDGAAAIAQAGRFLLFDEPGCGKTACTLLGLMWRQNLGHEVFPLVIITPSWPVCDAWRREIDAWCPGWPEPVMHGGPDRLTRLEDKPEILLTTYETARRDAPDVKGPLCKLGPAATVIDEIHFCKQTKITTEKGNSTRTAAVQRIALHAGTVIGLTGTPITRDTGDAWGALCATDPKSFPASKRFKDRYCEITKDEYEEKITGLKTLAAPEFFMAMTGQMRRVRKKDVLTELPDKIYSVRRVELPPAYRIAYDGMAEDMLAALPDGQELNAMDTIAQMTFLTQLASSAADVEITEELDETTGLMKKHYHAILKAPCWKADVLLEIMAERPHHPVAAFAPSRQLVALAGQLAEKAGARVGYVTGIGQGVTQKSRQRDIDAFQAGKLDLICVSTKAGGAGITLTAAGTGVMLQRPWGLDESVQAEDRVHRYGSEIHEHGVEIIDILAVDTVESRVRDRLREKGGQMGAYVRDPDFVREMLGGLK